MGFLILIVFLIFSLFFIIKNKIVLRIDTFFRKGFRKNDDNYGVYVFTGKQRRREDVQSR